MEAPEDKENQPPLNSPDNVMEKLMQQLPKPTVRYPDEQGESTQILNFGESARSVFMLETPSEKRLRLVVALKEAPRSVAKWLELLRCPLPGDPTTHKPYNKSKLVIRAITCINPEAERNSAGYTEICLMFAKLGSTEEKIRRTFQELKRRKVGVKQPLLYEEEAAFEYAVGNKDKAEEVLERGVDNDAITPMQKEELMKKVIAGRAGWVTAFAGSPQEQKVLALRTKKALRRTQDSSWTENAQNGVTTPRGLSSHVTTPLHSSNVQTETTPRGLSSHVTTPLHSSNVQPEITPRGLSTHVTTPLHSSYVQPETTPVSQRQDNLVTDSSRTTTPNSHSRSEAGFSTVSKAPRTTNKSPMLTTPSLPTRPTHKSQSTSRKTHRQPVRFQLGGPPLRVMTSSMNQSDNDDDEDDDDDAMMGSQATSAVPDKRMTPIKEALKPTSNSLTNSEVKKKSKLVLGDISHILTWDPDKEQDKIKLKRKTDLQDTLTGSKNSEATGDHPVKPAVAVTFKPPVEEKEPEKNSDKLPSTKTTRVELPPESKKVSPVSVDTTIASKKPSTPEDTGHRSPRAHRPFPWEIKSGAARSESQTRPNNTSRATDHYRSPKRQHLEPGIAAASKFADLSSPDSVSSASSPPVASMSTTISQDALESLTSRVVINGQRYIKLEQIGSGGSSKVYRMLGPDLKIYALKKIKLKKLDAQSIAQYTNEINLLKKLQGNPHIIRLIAAEQDLQQRQINVVMEHGEIDLSERLSALKGDMNENMLRVIWSQMLKAVNAIHQKRIIHGDLKPANFLFVNGALKLIDFGIAKTISNDTTNIERDSQIGTVNFMSPEAIQGNTTPNGQRDPEGKMKVGRASDIWSLGCILYQIVYSKPPFGDVPSIIEKFRCIIDPSVPIPFPSLQNRDLEDVIRSCLQRDHRLRPPIDGEGGLLQHPFLSGNSGANITPTNTVTMANATVVLSQLGDLLRSRGVATSHVNMFMSIGQDGLRSTRSGVPQTPHYLYNTQERRTDI